MSGAQQVTFMNQRSFGPPAIGSAYEGGFFAGQISTTANGIATHNLVIGPLSTAQNVYQYKSSNTGPILADSNINGPSNTTAMVADGDSTVYPAAHFCSDLVTGGYSDWYMPAKNELEVCYYNLKPTTTLNNTSSGANTNAVPSRASNYTSGTPAQTSAAAFQTGGAEAFIADSYWSSSLVSTTVASRQSFSSGYQFNGYKTTSNYVRAIRRVAV